MNTTFSFHPEISDALANRDPVVALESTVIAHGLPYPQNVETALKTEQMVRDHGAVPATIAIINGQIKVGLTADEIELLGKSQGVEKVSARDIPFVVAGKKNGATTVAGTCVIAHRAGIRIFATGGIGGVHRLVLDSMDISADLTTLAQSNVAVVSAGAKAILDLPKTLEAFETLNIPVIGYRTNEFPAFYSSVSGLSLSHRAETAEELSRILHAKWDLGLHGGVLIANPIPPAYDMDGAATERLIDEALYRAKHQDISGKAVTPFLLKYLNENSDGKLPEANRQLLWNNAKLAAEVAVAFYH